MPLTLMSVLPPPAMSHESGMPFRLQSGSPSQASPIESPSQSACVGFEIVGQLSHASPRPSASRSDCVGLETPKQLSKQSDTPSPSASRPSSVLPLQLLSTPSQTSDAPGLIAAFVSLQSRLFET